MFGIISSDACEIIFVHSNAENSLMTQKLSSKSKCAIPPTWILINSQSTMNVFCNVDLLSQIHKVNTTMHIRCYARAKCTNLHGYISGYSWVWYFPGDLANILSLSHVKEKYRVTFNSALDTCFHVHTKGNILKFCEAMQRHFTLTLENSTRTPLCS